MRTSSSTLVAVLLLLALAPLGCRQGAASGGGDAAPAGSVTTTASTAVAPASTGADPSCALVTQAEAEAIFGEPLQPLTAAYNGMCEYRRAADLGKKMTMPLAGLKLYPGESKAVFEAETKNVAAVMHTPLKPLAGFGDEAYEIGTFQIMALAHGKAISATHLQPLDRAKFEAFARKALSRL
jgi:hypothetical protein